ncbi:MAG: hypothetical protein LRZ84_21870 [Desertifilum sp.]|nr:hypothetical protein [Desertifilum sp.]
MKKIIINIEIDEEKKQQQIAAITESDTFTELQTRAAELRQTRQRTRRRERPTPVLTPATPEDDSDYLQNLQQKGKTLRRHPETTPLPEAASPLVAVRETPNGTSNTVDFFDRFRRQPQATPVLDTPPPPPSPTPSEAELPSLPKRARRRRPSSEPRPLTAPRTAEDETDYLQSLQQRGQQLKKT